MHSDKKQKHLTMSLSFLRHVDVEVAEPFKRTSRSGRIRFNKHSGAPKAEKHPPEVIRFHQPVVYRHFKAEVTRAGIPVLHFFKQLDDSILQEGWRISLSLKEGSTM